MFLFALLSCQRESPVEAECVELDSSEHPVYFNSAGNRYRIAQLAADGFTELYTLIAIPGATGWTKGSPIAISIPPLLLEDSDFNTEPGVYTRPELGIIELQPVWPGWSLKDQQTDGPHDAAGARSVAALSAVVRFAAGEGLDIHGDTIEAYLDVPACIGPVYAGSYSSGSIALMGALSDPEVREHIAGVSIYEPPLNPQLTIAEPGAIWLDPRPEEDTDGNGLFWDEGRNQSLIESECTLTGCPTDRSALAWTDAVALPDLLKKYHNDLLEPGVLYLDRDGDGELSLRGKFGVDFNTDGILSIDEDIFTRPHVDESTNRLFYTPELLAEAISSGALQEGDWPSSIATLGEASAFWGERDFSAHLLASDLTDLPVVVVYREMPHGPTMAQRTDIWLLAEALADAGAVVRHNPSVDASSCVLGAGTYVGGPEPGTSVALEEIQSLSIPLDVDVESAKSLTIVSAVWAGSEPTTACPEGL